MSGPARKPTALLAPDSWRRKKRKSEPKPPQSLGAAPRHLTAAQKSVWRQLTAQLRAMGVGAAVDGHALERYCVDWLRWRRAQAYIAAQGETYKLTDGSGAIRCIMPYPEVAIINKLNISLLRIEQEFGLTPAARTRIQVAPPSSNDNPKLKYFAG